jgi:hypothetical protein
MSLFYASPALLFFWRAQCRLSISGNKMLDSVRSFLARAPKVSNWGAIDRTHHGIKGVMFNIFGFAHFARPAPIKKLPGRMRRNVNATFAYGEDRDLFVPIFERRIGTFRVAASRKGCNKGF